MKGEPRARGFGGFATSNEPPSVPLWRRIEAPTWGLIFLIYGGWLAVTWFFTAMPWWLAVPLGAWLTAWHSSFQHEALHGHPTRSARINALLAWPPLSLWLPYPIYRSMHLTHHRDSHLTCPANDPESFYMTAARWRSLGMPARRFWIAYNTLAGRLLLGPAVHALRLWRSEASAILRGDMNKLRVWARHGLGVALVLYWATAVCGIPILVYLFGFAYAGMSLILLRSYAEHRAAADPLHRTAIVEGALPWRLLYLGNNYHVLHHERPAMPWYDLAAGYRAERRRLLAQNDGYLVSGYGQLFRRYLFKPKEAPVHPYDA